MSAFDSLLRFLGLPKPPKSPKHRQFALDEDLFGAVQDLAAWERSSPDDVANRLVAEALQHRRLSADSLALWEQLTPREREVTELTCLGFTGRQVAERLSISPETVKSHISNILDKCGVHSRAELRAVFASWNFTSR